MLENLFNMLDLKKPGSLELEEFITLMSNEEVREKFLGMMRELRLDVKSKRFPLNLTEMMTMFYQRHERQQNKRTIKEQAPAISAAHAETNIRNYERLFQTELMDPSLMDGTQQRVVEKTKK